MIFHRALQRELTGSAAGVFVALLSILLTTHLIRLLNQAAGGRLAPESVAALLGFTALNALPVLLSLTLFISVLLTLSRSYRDSEMVVWFSSGVPLTAWVWPVLRFALPVIAAVAALSLLLTPWAAGKSEEFRERQSQREDASRVSPGAFRETRSGERVIFVENVAGDENSVQNIFISSVQHGRLGVMAAARGRQETAPNGDRFLILENGRRYEGVPGEADFRSMEFSRYGVRVEARDVAQPAATYRNMSTGQLLRQGDRVAQGELLWRFGLPISAFVLTLLAIPMSFVNPRAGRSLNLIFAILVFMVYNNLLNVSQAWVWRGKLDFPAGLWGAHALMLALLALLFYRRIAVLPFLSVRALLGRWRR